MSDSWNPKGGEFEVKSVLVEIDEIVGPPSRDGAGSAKRPDSGNLQAKRAMASISLDFILGKPILESKLRLLREVLPEEAAFGFELDEGAPARATPPSE